MARPLLIFFSSQQSLNGPRVESIEANCHCFSLLRLAVLFTSQNESLKLRRIWANDCMVLAEGARVRCSLARFARELSSQPSEGRTRFCQPCSGLRRKKENGP